MCSPSNADKTTFAGEFVRKSRCAVLLMLTKQPLQVDLSEKADVQSSNVDKTAFAGGIVRKQVVQPNKTT